MAVKFDQHIDIHAPADTVWAIMLDPNKWPLWFPDIEHLVSITALETGGTFQWQNGNETGSGSIVALDRGADLLKVVTQVGSNQVTHTFDVDRSGGFLGLGGNGARLRYTLEYDPPGGFIADFVAGGNPKDILKVKHTLEKVKGLAEGK